MDLKLLHQIIKNPITELSNIGFGTDNLKDSAPNVYQVYLATNTKKIYYCLTDGEWIEYDPLDVVYNGIIYRMPETDGLVDQVLKTNGSKQLYWDDLAKQKASAGFYFEGAANIGEYIIHGIKHLAPVSVLKATINARTAPVGADIIIELTKDGIGTGKIFTLPQGAKKVTANILPEQFSTSEEVGFIFTQVGTGEAGQGEGISFTYHYESQVAGTILDFNIIPFYFEAELINGEIIVDGILIPSNFTTIKLLLSIRDVATGSNIEITVTKNGLITSAEAILLQGEKKRETTISNISFTPSDELGFKITEVGSNFAGAGLSGVLFIS